MQLEDIPKKKQGRKWWLLIVAISRLNEVTHYDIHCTQVFWYDVFVFRWLGHVQTYDATTWSPEYVSGFDHAHAFPGAHVGRDGAHVHGQPRVEPIADLGPGRQRHPPGGARRDPGGSSRCTRSGGSHSSIAEWADVAVQQQGANSSAEEAGTRAIGNYSPITSY